MAKFTKEGHWYVDGFYGNDTTGTGTREKPFRTMLRAHTAATTGQRVICRGWFYDPIPGSKTLHWEGEGLCMFDGSKVADGTPALTTNAWGSVTAMWFYNWQIGWALQSGSALPVVDCRFDHCRVVNTSGGASLRWNWNGNIFNECVISTGSGAHAGSIQNCTFTNCSGGIATGANNNFNIKNNIFHLCNTLQCVMPLERPATMEFNYNCITGGLGGRTNAEWQAYGAGQYQADGIAVPATEIFNDYSAGRDSGTYWMQDYTIKPGSPVADGSSQGLEIGAKRIGYRFSANALWNTYRESSTNIGFSATRGLILLDAGKGAGEYVSTWIPVLAGGMQFDMLNLNAIFVLDAAGEAQQYISKDAPVAPNSTINQRRAFDVDFAISSNNSDAPVWKKQEFYRRIRLDQDGRGVADDNYTPNVVQIPQGSFFKIRFTLRNITV